MAAIASPRQSINDLMEVLSLVKEAHIERSSFRENYFIRYGDGEGPYTEKAVSVFLQQVQQTLNRLADYAPTLSIKHRKIILVACSAIEQAFQKAKEKGVLVEAPTFGKEVFCRFPVDSSLGEVEGARLRCIQIMNQKINYLEVPAAQVLKMPDEETSV